MRYTKHVKPKQGTGATSQNQPMPGTSQVPNSGGGYSFEVDVWQRLHRFLILGSENGSYYATERALTQANAASVVEAISIDGVRVVNEVVAVSSQGRAPKNDPAIFVLAMASKLGSDETRAWAREAIPKVCRTGTHILQFAEAINAYGGWGRGTKRGIANWFNSQSVDALAYQVVKYQQRNGWSQRDLLRLSHPKAKKSHNEIYRWVTTGSIKPGVVPLIDAFEKAKRASKKSEIVSLIRDAGLPREAIPTKFLSEPDVWEALLEKMPYTALIRNLATMTRIELLTNRSRATKQVIKQLVDSQGLLLSRVHPVQVLSALLTYNKGQGQRGTGVWKPVPQVSAALDAAFYASFKNVEPTGRKLMLALDVSGSMRSPEIARCPGLTPRVASVAMALVLARVEKDCMFTAFMDKLTRLEFKPDTTLDEACKFIDRLQFGATDCSLPMQYAQAKKLDLDAFVILTDSETNAGSMHPTEALRKYRAAHDVPAKLVVVGMVSNGFTIADPNDAGMMDVVGFDTATPQIIEDFIR